MRSEAIAIGIKELRENRFLVHQHINARNNAREASIVLGKVFLLQERNGKLAYCRVKDFPELTGGMAVVGLFVDGKARHKYDI